MQRGSLLTAGVQVGTGYAQARHMSARPARPTSAWPSPGSAARGRETTWGPVDGGSARNLRAAAITANPARQLTGLCATAHRPDARAQVSSRDFSRGREKKTTEK